MDVRKGPKTVYILFVPPHTMLHKIMMVVLTTADQSKQAIQQYLAALLEHSRCGSIILMLALLAFIIFVSCGQINQQKQYSGSSNEAVFTKMIILKNK